MEIGKLKYDLRSKLAVVELRCLNCWEFIEQRYCDEDIHFTYNAGNHVLEGKVCKCGCNTFQIDLHLSMDLKYIK